MRPSPEQFWEALFSAPAEPGQAVHLQMRLLKKAGRPFLLLPGESRAASATMGLYPAQSARARAARTVLRWLLRASLAPGTERVSLTVSSADPFARHLSSLAGEPTQGLPVLGILAGNPMSAGQRFLLLIFDAGQRPVAVVKAGLSEQAKTLIEREEAFLAAVPATTKGIPKLRSTFRSPRLRALALDFYAGDSPRPEQEVALLTLLELWIDPKKQVTVFETPCWARLEQACAGNSLFPGMAGQLRGRTIPSTIQHGDFAPWNVKVSAAGAWKVLDWERGELTGIPGWDWFHYVIQNAILVRCLPTAALVQRVENLLDSAPFRQYAARGGITGCERELVLAYLLHVAEVIRPSEGLTATRELLSALATRWQRA